MVLRHAVTVLATLVTLMVAPAHASLTPPTSSRLSSNPPLPYWIRQLKESPEIFLYQSGKIIHPKVFTIQSIKKLRDAPKAYSIPLPRPRPKGI